MRINTQAGVMRSMWGIWERMGGDKSGGAIFNKNFKRSVNRFFHNGEIRSVRKIA